MEEEQRSSVGNNGYLHPCSLLQYFFKACLGFLDLCHDGMTPRPDQDDSKDPPNDEENEMKTREDGVLVQSLVSKRPQRPPPDGGRGGQKN